MSGGGNKVQVSGGGNKVQVRGGGNKVQVILHDLTRKLCFVSKNFPDSKVYVGLSKVTTSMFRQNN